MLKILLADDNEDGAATLRELLELDGHDVAVAHDGRTAFEKASNWRPELAALDIGMPEWDGYRVARSIRAESWGQDMYLIALTGRVGAGDKARANDAGFNSHLPKPLDLVAFRELVSSLDEHRDAD